MDAKEGDDYRPGDEPVKRREFDKFCSQQMERQAFDKGDLVKSVGELIVTGTRLITEMMRNWAPVFNLFSRYVMAVEKSANQMERLANSAEAQTMKGVD